MTAKARRAARRSPARAPLPSPPAPSLSTNASAPAPQTVTIVLRGAPRGKGRHRSRVVIPKDRKKKPFVHLYPEPETVAYEEALALVGKIAMRRAGRVAPFEGALNVTVTAVFSVPSSWPQRKREAAFAGIIRPTGKPDRDNIDKIVGDGLNKIVWNDDAQIVEGPVIKVYGEEARVEIKVRPVDLPLMSSGDNSD